MQITNLLLENFCQHKFRELTFDSGVTFITGSNGAGKSNLFRAIRGSITGDFDSRSMKGKSHDVSYGLEKGADATVSTAWSLARGNGFDVKRSIINTGAASLYELGKPVFIGKEAEVTERILKLFGVPRSVVQDCMFIGQRKVSSIFEVTNSARIDTLIDLTDASRATSLLKEVRKRYSKYQVYLSDHNNTDLVTTEAAYLEAKGVYAKIRDHRLEVKERLLLPIDQERINRVIQTKEAYDDYTEQIAKATASLEKLTDNSKEMEEKFKKAARVHKVRVKKFEDAKAEYDKQMKAYEEAVKLNNDYEYYQELLSDASKELPNKPKEIPYTLLSDEELENLQDLESTYESRIQMYKDKKCVTCNRPFNISEDAYNKSKSKLVKVQEKLKQHDVAIGIKQENEANRHMYELRVQGVKSSIEAAKKTIKERYPVAPEKTEEIEPDSTKHKELEDLAKQTEKAVNNYRGELNKLHGRVIEATNERQSKLRQKEKLNSPTDKEVKEAKKRWKQHVEMSQQYEELQDQERGANNSLLTAIRNFRAARHQARRMKKLAPAADLLKDTVELCNKLPGRTVAELAKRVEPSINDTLDQMGSDFTISVNELLEFSITRNGFTFPRERMSGGQCCVAGLAFWLAIANVAGLDCIFMDEPIDGLDADAEAMLPDVFTRIDSMFREANKQLIVITHHKQLAQVGNRIHIG